MKKSPEKREKIFGYLISTRYFCTVINEKITMTDINDVTNKSAAQNGNAEFMNRMNKIRVLNVLHQYGQISRTQIVKLTGLSAPTVTRIIDSLINTERLVATVGRGDSKGGRPPVILEFKGSDRYVIGIDWGRTHILGVLTDLNGEVVKRINVHTGASGDFTTDMKHLISLVRRLIVESVIDYESLMGIGIAIGGYIKKANQKVQFAPNFGWSDVDVKRPLESEFGVPVLVDNVSQVMAQGELLHGIGKDIKDFVFVNIAHGIGAGVVSNGVQFKGFDGYAGEIGHTLTPGKNEGYTCVCGKQDCLECYASGRGIAERAKEQLASHPESALAGLEEISAHNVAQAAAAGDELAQKILNTAADTLGAAIANMSNVFNPEAVVVGGGVTRSGAAFVARIREQFEKNQLRNTGRMISLTESTLKDQAAVLGAASLMINEVLQLRVDIV